MNILLASISLVLVALCKGAYYEDSFAQHHDEVKAKTNSWQIGYNQYFEGKSKEEMFKLLGALFNDEPEQAPKKLILTRNAVPAEFDSRKQWPECSNEMGFIRDQSACGSCWAVSSAEVMSDRTCIKSGGNHTPFISDEDILSCCTTCGFGCNGGYPTQAFKFWTKSGVVTGGPYGSKDGCRPYSISPTAQSAETPACQKQCQATYKTPYPQDEQKGSSYFQIQGGASAMQQEILDNGPIVACFNVYEDFFHYSTGVYHHVSGSLAGGHAVKVIGWGTENNTPYWLVANSWNATWGGLNGYFKIQRGNNECGFEAQSMAGLA